MPDLFAELETASNEKWLAQIQKELKGIDLSTLATVLEPGLQAEPFLHPALQPNSAAPLWTKPIDWSINEDISTAEGLATAQAQIASALEFGATRLSIQVHTDADLKALPILLSPVYLEMVELSIVGSMACKLSTLETLAAIRSSKGLTTDQVRLFLEADISAIIKQSPEEAILFFDRLRQIWPTAHAWHISPDPSKGWTEGLADLLEQTETLFAFIKAERGADALKALHIHYTIPIGKIYFAEIARLRAFTLLYYNLCANWDRPLQKPNTHVRMNPDAYTDEVYTNLIRATTMAMSAVIGGCSCLTVLAFAEGRKEKNPYGDAFARRIARNVQHLLKMESGLHLLADAGAGSYYIEDLTQKMAEKAWTSVTTG